MYYLNFFRCSLENDLDKEQEILKKTLNELLISLDKKPQSTDTIKIYQKIISVMKIELDVSDQSNKKCLSCGELLDSWEHDICGPCKIKDDNYQEESEE